MAWHILKIIALTLLLPATLTICAVASGADAAPGRPTYDAQVPLVELVIDATVKNLNQKFFALTSREHGFVYFRWHRNDGQNWDYAVGSRQLVEEGLAFFKVRGERFINFKIKQAGKDRYDFIVAFRTSRGSPTFNPPITFTFCKGKRGWTFVSSDFKTVVNRVIVDLRFKNLVPDGVESVALERKTGTEETYWGDSEDVFQTVATYPY